MANTNSNNCYNMLCVISCKKCFLIDIFFKQKDKKHPVQIELSVLLTHKSESITR